MSGDLGRIEDADADTAMVTPDGDRFFPDNPDDALIFSADHGAMPEHPDRWPWPDAPGTDEAVPTLTIVFDVSPEQLLPTLAEIRAALVRDGRRRAVWLS